MANLIDGKRFCKSMIFRYKNTVFCFKVPREQDWDRHPLLLVPQHLVTRIYSCWQTRVTIRGKKVMYRKWREAVKQICSFQWSDNYFLALWGFHKAFRRLKRQHPASQAFRCQWANSLGTAGISCVWELLGWHIGHLSPGLSHVHHCLPLQLHTMKSVTIF